MQPENRQSSINWEILKTILNIIQIFLIALIVANSLMWLAAYASGHRIPDKTNYTFLIISFILLFLLVIIVWLKRHFNKRKKIDLEQT